jgi:acyl dehydratase
MVLVDTLFDLADFVGRDLEPSPWITIDQGMISQFAQVTDDHNWTHVDLERAARDNPGGKTIAHGLLTLSLVVGLAGKILGVRRQVRAFNYGFDKVRFIHPVPVDSRVRLHMKVLSAQTQTAGLMIHRNFTMELEGAPRPAMVAHMLTLVVG